MMSRSGAALTGASSRQRPQLRQEQTAPGRRRSEERQPPSLMRFRIMWYLKKSMMIGKGPSIYDVNTEGGLENWLILWMNSTDRLREMRTKGGGGGSRIPKILRTS